jgi:glutamate synthase (NADPH/NADH) large chain
MTRYDALRLRGLIEKHLRYTDSSLARTILDNWTEYLPRFVKVMPVDYRRALEQIKQSQNEAAQLAAVAGGK